ncbi:nervous system development [Seminavis robusta]|uniref:Nervous system development n=1 Tax=Seminavis robusta TaxID=568900 RepID=A0A9N8E5B9_9STRA|nr:nervous system development [Seminavis robusta]|eukprot:Sro515_g158330.1 nervous system development (271) ;mRNA; f:38630-39442
MDGVDSKVDTYHVHKVNLACGIRKSEYFDRLFQNDDKFPEGLQSTSCIELHSLAAKAFTDMLDYLYDHSKEVNISVQTAASLYYLGEYFEIHQLQCDALDFIKKVPLNTCHIIVQHAMIFHNDTIIQAVGEALSKAIWEICEDDDIVYNLFCPQLWLHISSNMDMGDENAGQQFSSLIADFVNCRQESLDTATFRELTSEKNMPFLDDRSSLLYLELEKSIHQQDGKEVVAEGTMLGKRCVKAIAAGGYHFDSLDDKEPCGEYSMHTLTC